VVSHGHFPTAIRADDETLEQGGALSWGAASPILAPGLSITLKLANILIEALKGDVSFVGVRDENRPLISREFLGVETSVLITNASGASERVGSGIEGMMEKL
jgi:hypothetical protein